MSAKIRKVQAQRKFAQGAVILPYTNNNNNIERHTEGHEKPAPQPPILQNSCSASELLDKISFNNIHTHETRLQQPIVRLERLTGVQAPRPRIRQSFATESNLSYNIGVPLLLRVQKKHSRNRIQPKNRVLRKRVPVKKNIKMKRIARSRRKLPPRRYNAKRKCCKEDTDAEDDTPLKYLVKSTKIAKTVPVASTSAAATTRNNLRSPAKPPILNGSNKGSKSLAKGNTITSPVTRNNKSPAKQDDASSKVGSPDFEGFYCPDNIERWIAGAENASQFKVPLPPRNAKRPKSQASTIKLYPAQGASAADKRNGNGPRGQHSEDNATQGQKTNTQPVTNSNNDKVKHDTSERSISPLPAESSASNDVFVEADRPPSVCPSERYVTVKDVVRASEQERRERCKICKNCLRANKVEKLSQVVQATTDGRGLDVYEFDIEREGNDPSLKGFRSRRRPDKEEAVTTNSNFVYLDILPSPSTHVIQIKLTPVLNQKKPMMQARLMPKNTAASLNEYNLVEHEGLFEQLIETLDSQLLKRLSVSKSLVRSDSVAVPENGEKSQRADAIGPLPGTSKDVRSNRVPRTSNRTVNKGLGARQKSRTGPYVAKKDIKTGATAGPANVPARPAASSAAAGTAAVVDAEAPGTGGLLGRNASLQIGPKTEKAAVVCEAPVYYPTEAEFNDPVAYFEKIMPTASKYGLCKVVAPASFKPKCTINDKIRFQVANQYIARLYTRWGPACKEMCAIKAHLFSQSVPFTRAPILDSLEVDLPKLYRTVQRLGGLNTVIEKKGWGRVAEQMRFAKKPQLVKKLDDIYVKYLLPYDTLSSQEREDIRAQVSKSWHKKNEKIMQRMANPLHRQKQLLGEGGSSTSDTEDESNIASALTEAEDCIVSGARMTLAHFTKVAQAVKDQYFPDTAEPTPREVEDEYWRIVLLASEHICVNTASIDTGDEGYGFPKSRQDPYGTHPWNPKMISQNPGNVLAMLGPVLGVTVPTLHLGMIFSTSCWHRDPHGLPWLEYMHTGPAKIWYGIPDDQSASFRTAVERLCPTSCQNKSIWLPSDITMIPPNFLLSNNVSLTRVEQRPGEYIIVFPKAYSSSISTGYTQSESVYFATNSWLKSVDHVFHELRDSCEPTMFSLEQLLISVAGEPRAPASLLQLVHTTLATIVDDELQHRRELARLGVPPLPAPPAKRPAAGWNDECEVCRSTLYLSKVTGLIEKDCSVCLKHALRLLTSSKTKRDVTGLSLVVFFTTEQLGQVMSKLQSGICPQ